MTINSRCFGTLPDSGIRVSLKLKDVPAKSKDVTSILDEELQEPVKKFFKKNRLARSTK